MILSVDGQSLPGPLFSLTEVRSKSNGLVCWWAAIVLLKQ